jgi:hypothetical protein
MLRSLLPRAQQISACDGALWDTEACRRGAQEFSMVREDRRRPVVLLVDSTFNDLHGLCGCGMRYIYLTGFTPSIYPSIPAILLSPFLCAVPLGMFSHKYAIAMFYVKMRVGREKERNFGRVLGS